MTEQVLKKIKLVVLRSFASSMGLIISAQGGGIAQSQPSVPHQQQNVPVPPSLPPERDGQGATSINQQQEVSNINVDEQYSNDEVNGQQQGMSPTQKEVYELFLEPYNYDPSGSRDPFVRLDNLNVVADDITTGRQQRPLLPLERFELSDIKLIGIIWSVDSPRAMFLDPTSKVHVLSKDQRIGRNQGYIAVIREGEVVVVETTLKNGDPVYTSRVLRITK